MKKIFLLALCALTLVSNAATYNYLCAITDLTVDTLASSTKNQFTLNWTQKCKNIAEYSSKPQGTYTTTVKLVLNSDDRTLEGTYTTVGASETSSSANVNDQTINLVTSELYYGDTRRLLRSDSISTFTIIKVDETHYGISIGRLCFTAAALANRGKNTYNYNYCYAEDEILTQGIEPKPYIFGYDSEYHEQVYNYDMTVNGISVMRDDSDYGSKRYFLTLNCVGKNRDTNAERNYEVQLAIYPNDESIVGSFATQNSGLLLWASNSYVKDLKANKQRYLANDSLSTIQIAAKGTNQYSFFGGTLTCTDMDANYMAVYGKKRIEAVHYYHFSDNGGQGIPFGFDENNKEVALTASNAVVESTINGLEITLQTTDSNSTAYTVYIVLESETIDGAFTTNDNLSTWSKVSRNTNDSYIASGSTVTINAKSGNKHTISANLLCENEFTYKLNAFDFTYVKQLTGIENQELKAKSQKLILDGQMFILRGEKIFDAQGKQVK
jgi:hypothetical protein